MTFIADSTLLAAEQAPLLLWFHPSGNLAAASASTLMLVLVTHRLGYRRKMRPRFFGHHQVVQQHHLCFEVVPSTVLVLPHHCGRRPRSARRFVAFDLPHLLQGFGVDVGTAVGPVQ